MKTKTRDLHRSNQIHRRLGGFRFLRMSAFVKDYPTPAPRDDAIRKALLVGRHPIILNKSGTKPTRVAYIRFRPAAKLNSNHILVFAFGQKKGGLGRVGFEPKTIGLKVLKLLKMTINHNQ